VSVKRIMHDEKTEDKVLLSKIDSIDSDEQVFGEAGCEIEVGFNHLEGLKNKILLVKSSIRGEFFDRVTDNESIISLLLKYTSALGVAAVSAAEVSFAQKHLCSLSLSISEEKEDFVRIHSREKSPYVDAVDVSDMMNDNLDSTNIKIRWTDTHALSFVGVAESTPVKDEEIERLGIKEISHSHRELKTGEPIELLPEQYINLEFLDEDIRTDMGMVCTYVLRTMGRYKSLV
jgi:hypothetical protein